MKFPLVHQFEYSDNSALLSLAIYIYMMDGCSKPQHSL